MTNAPIQAAARERLLSIVELLDRIAEVTGTRPDRVTVWRWVRRGAMPAPSQLGLRRLFWRESEIDEWLASR
jgi:predicted DNA-binding transcriptional regulator AlpA